MVSPLGRLGSVVKLPVQVRMFPEEIEAVDAFAAELSQQSYGAAFSRAEALWMVVYLGPADKYPRLTRRLLQGYKGR